jgi:hypothetical protein
LTDRFALPNSQAAKDYSFGLAITFFTSQTCQEALVILVSFPEIKGALPPTIGTALVHANPTFRIAKNPTLTHKEYANK